MSHSRALGIGVGTLSLVLLVVPLICETHLQGADNDFDATGVKKVAFQNFARDLRQVQMDLVILIERSKSVGTYNSYQSRVLVNKVLRYYTKVDPDYVQVAVATFAMDFIVHFDGINKKVSKCDIWDSNWDQSVPEGTKGTSDSTNISLAIQETFAIFQRTSSRPRYLWVISENSSGSEISQTMSNPGVTLLVTTIGSEEMTHTVPYVRHVYHTGDVSHTLAVLRTIRPLQRLSSLKPINSTHYCDAYGHTIGTCERCLYSQERVGHHVPSRIHLHRNVSSVMSWPVATIDHECRPDEGDCVCITTKTTNTCLAPHSYVERDLPFAAQAESSVYWTIGGVVCCTILLCLQCIICIIPAKQLEPGVSG